MMSFLAWAAYYNIDTSAICTHPATTTYTGWDNKTMSSDSKTGSVKIVGGALVYTTTCDYTVNGL